MADLVAEIAVSEAKFRQQTRKVFDDALRATADFERQANAKLKDFGKGFANSEMTKAQAREFDRLKKQFDPLYAASKRYEGQLDRLNQAQKVGALSAKQYEAALETLNAEFSGAAPEMQRVGGASRAFGGRIQNAAFQVQDFAVQVAGGTSASKALAQQLPQVLGGLGIWGAVAGAAAAIAIPLGAAWLNAGEEAGTLEEQLDKLTDTTDAMIAATEKAQRPIHELRDAFGSLADEVSRADQAQAFFSAEIARRNLTGTAAAMSRDLFGGAFQSGQARPAGDFDDITARGLRIRKLADMLQVSTEEARAFEDALASLGDLSGPEEVLAVTEQLLTALSKSPEAAAKYASEIESLGALNREAARQIQAGVSETQKLLDKYGGTTRELRQLTDDRAAAERALAQAQKEGNTQLVTDLNEVLVKLDEQIAKVKELAGETDGAFRQMASAIGEYMGKIGSSMMGAIAPGMGAIDLIKDFEGFRSKAYWDVNAYRAGFGSDTVTRPDGSVEQVTQATVVTLADANRDLARRIGEFQAAIMGEIGAQRWGQFTTEQQAALTSIAYNYGSLPDRIIEAVRGGTSQDIATAIGRLAGDNSGVNQARRMREASAFGSTTAASGEIQAAAQAQSERQAALEAETRERERQLELVQQYSQKLASDLVTEQERAELERQRAEAVAAINASNMSESDKAAAIAEVNGEMQKQLTIMALMEEANRRGVDLNAQMVNSTMTYAQAIEALGEAKKQSVITDQQVAASAANAAEAQKFWADQQRALEDGLIDAIVAGENFADVLANVAQALAKAALQAALFGSGPFGNGSGLLSGLFSFGGGDPLTSALRGAGVSFDGGGFTGHGARSGGIDGKGGFPAILHPNETVIDHTRGQTVGANMTYNPSIIIQGNPDERTMTLIESALERERAAFFRRWIKSQQEYSTRIA